MLEPSSNRRMSGSLPVPASTTDGSSPMMALLSGARRSMDAGKNAVISWTYTEPSSFLSKTAVKADSALKTSTAIFAQRALLSAQYIRRYCPLQTKNV